MVTVIDLDDSVTMLVIFVHIFRLTKVSLKGNVFINVITRAVL